MGTQEKLEIYYRDWGVPEVERLAKAICRKRGMTDDTMVPETGYAGARATPAWWMYQDAALNFIAMQEAMSSSEDK